MRNQMNNQQPTAIPQQPQVQPPLRPKNIQNVPQVEIKNNVETVNDTKMYMNLLIIAFLLLLIQNFRKRK